MSVLLKVDNLQFPAIQVPHAGANVLDDYEEGTWTPVLSGSSVAGTPTYAANGQIGVYTKVGRIVAFTIFVSITAKTGVSGNILVSLPVAARAGTNTNPLVSVGNTVGITHTAGYTYLQGMINPGDSVVLLMQSGSGVAGAFITDAMFAAATLFQVSGFYFTA